MGYVVQISIISIVIINCLLIIIIQSFGYKKNYQNFYLYLLLNLKEIKLG